jgi:hypothetical protein
MSSAGRKLVTIVAWLAVIPTVFVLLASWFGAIGFTLAGSWWAMAWIAAAAGSTYAFVRLAGRILARGKPRQASADPLEAPILSTMAELQPGVAIRQSRPRTPGLAGAISRWWLKDWDEPIRAAMAGLPPGIKVRRSRAGRQGFANSLGWGIFILGLIAAFGVWYAGAANQEYSPGAPGTEPLAMAIAATTGLTAGTLLAVARDGRGRRTRLRTIVIPPILLAAWATFGGEAGDSASNDRLLLGAVVLLVTALPVLAGYLLARALVAFYQSGRVDLTLQTSGPALPPELEAATDSGQAMAVLREYALRDVGLVTGDQRLLDGAGYQTAAISDATYDGRTDDRKVLVLFVKKGVLALNSASDASATSSSGDGRGDR